MLDERIPALAERTSRTQLADRDQVFPMTIGEIRANLRGNGRLYIYVAMEYEKEVLQRAAIVWRNLQRAHNSMGAPRPETLQQDLLESFKSQLDRMIQELAPCFNRDMQGCPPGAKLLGKLDDARLHELARHEAEIEHYIATVDAALARGTAPRGEYNFYGNVGAVMTGADATAHIVQNIGAEQREALLAALRDVKQVLLQAPSLPPRDQQEFLELADEATAEVTRDSPNTRRLSMILQSLAATVQGIASGPGAYEILRAAAGAIGILI